ncbi:MAG: hydantoinase B/oxoprolinase family protein [Candidatus Dormibacteria bacterium]
MAPNRSKVERRLDPVTFQVLRNAFRAICSEGSAMVERVAYHPTITEGHDYSVALLTADGRMIGNGHRDQTPHFGSFEFSVRAVIEDFPTFRSGDVFIVNDPHRCGTHPQDVRIIRPILRGSEVIAFVVALCHWADVGGLMPGSFYPKATECYSEGLHLPPMKLFEDDHLVEPVWRLIELNVRTPWDRVGDMQAQHHACKLVDKRLSEYVDRYGLETMLAAFEEQMDYTERLFRAEVGDLPDGTFEFIDFIDRDEGQSGHPRVKVSLKMTISGSDVTYDFSGSDPIFGPAGVTYPAMHSAAFDGTLHVFSHLAPLTNGLVRSIEFVSTPGTVTRVVRPTPTAGYCAGAYEKIDACVMACWAQAFVGTDRTRIYAGTVNLQNICLGGTHPDTGLPYVSYTWVEGGQGAMTDGDGPTGLMMLFISGAGNQPIEVHERWYPWLYTDCQVIQDSAGDGRFRGGFGVRRNWKVLGECLLTVHGDREEVGPYGLAGGSNGGPTKLILNAGTPDERNLGMYASGIAMKVNDHITFGSNGGGGLGNPLERDPNLVLEDVIDDFLSLAKARDTYGVVIDAVDPEALDFRLDAEATKELRVRMAGVKRPEGFGPWQVHPYGARLVIPEKKVAVPFVGETNPIP